MIFLKISELKILQNKLKTKFSKNQNGMEAGIQKIHKLDCSYFLHFKNSKIILKHPKAKILKIQNVMERCFK
jgi:hypothetical protein